jgi:hypothetical protein
MRRWISASLGLVFVFTLVFSFALSLVPDTEALALDCCYKLAWCNGVQSMTRGHYGFHHLCYIDGSHPCDALCQIN